MKKVVSICCAIAALFLASCEEMNPGGYQGTNYIELTSSVTSMYDAEGAKIDVTASLVASLAEDLTITLKLDGDEVALDPASVTFKAGEKTAGFSIKSVKAIKEETKTFTVTLDTEKTVLPEKVVWKEDFTITVKASNPNGDNEGEEGGNEGEEGGNEGEEGGNDGEEGGNEDETNPMAAVIEAYKNATGVDLSKYTGVVNCSVEYTYYDFETYELVETPATWTTASIIELSEESTAENPVLNMTGNPMGMEEEMYKLLRAQTVESIYWTDADAGPEYKILMDGINWNAESNETFKMALYGITLNTDGSIDFVGTALDNYGDEIAAVAFDYTFSAYERELNATLDIEEGSDATANPYYWLFCTSIEDDDWGNDDGVYEPAYANISAEKMEFVYCFDYSAAGGYNKVKVTYTPNK